MASVDAVADRRLHDGPEAQTMPAMHRYAWPGEVCWICEEPFDRGEIVDAICQYGAHPQCFEDLIAEVDDD